MIDIGTAAILAAIGFETYLSYRQGREHAALLGSIWVELARQNVGKRLPKPNGHWRPGWPSVLSGRLIGYNEQPAAEQEHLTSETGQGNGRH